MLACAPAWLASLHPDAEPLLIVWHLTGDEHFLIEAAEKFPKVARVCYTMIYHCGIGSEEAKAWLDRLYLARPLNPEIPFIEASALMTRKDRAGAIKALRRAAGMNHLRRTHQVNGYFTCNAAMTAGEDQAGAIRRAVAIELREDHDALTLRTARQALLEEIQDATAAGDDQRVMDIIAIGLATALKFSDSHDIRVDLAACDLQRKLLESLPGDTEIDAGGDTAPLPAAEMLAAVEEKRASLEALSLRRSEARVWLRTASPEEVFDYYMHPFGDAYATRELLEKLDKGRAQTAH
ncbi:MAG TPA: hypothetical protein VG796_07920 [Verrucomicrobiales bacterium]|nr:hypothetical protein [Verrucomicrobiales bacterium]